MQIEKENSNKIKIILKPIDLNELNVTLESLKPNSPELHNFLYEVMERVREETGFNPYSGQIIVEALPVGECMVLTVTRISVPKSPAQLDRTKIKKVRAVAKKPTQKHTAYSFDSFDDFCGVLTALDKDTLQNADYYMLGKQNVLLVNKASEAARCILKEYSYKSKSNGVIASYFSEHAKHIAGGEKLISMAEGIASL